MVEKLLKRFKKKNISGKGTIENDIKLNPFYNAKNKFSKFYMRQLFQKNVRKAIYMHGLKPKWAKKNDKIDINQLKYFNYTTEI